MIVIAVGKNGLAALNQALAAQQDARRGRAAAQMEAFMAASKIAGMSQPRRTRAMAPPPPWSSPAGPPRRTGSA